MQRTIARAVILFALTGGPLRALEPTPDAALDVAAVVAAKSAMPHGTPHPLGDPPGDTIATAIPVPVIPFSDVGNTCDYENDYDADCPFTGSLSPDVVYAYQAPSPQFLFVSLCASAYDTKVYVYENGPGNLIACNDDACGADGFRSELTGIELTPGNTYYVVVDGYGGLCGEYTLDLAEFTPELVPCPAGAFIEGEADCADGYQDHRNGGCNSVPPVFDPLPPSPDGVPFSVCGTSGTFLVDGIPTRDTDWYELTIYEPEPTTFECGAEFPVQLLVIDGNAGCPGTVVASATAGSFPDVAILEWDALPGTYWYWIGPSVYSSVPCGAKYYTTITGYGMSILAARPSTWGSIKNGYRR